MSATTKTAPRYTSTTSVTAVERSSNGKLGDNVSATYATQTSCPDSCPLKAGGGCYAEYGFVAVTTKRLNGRTRDAETPRSIARAEARAIRGLSGRRLLRLHVVGDARTNEAAEILGDACREYSSGRRRRVWTYTHAWRDVERVSWGRHVSVLASCETAADVRAARGAGYATAIVVDRFESKAAYMTHDGVKVLPCPAMTGNAKCEDCRLCLDDDRLKAEGLTIGFEAHSQGENRVRAALEKAHAAGEQQMRRTLLSLKTV